MKQDLDTVRVMCVRRSTSGSSEHVSTKAERLRSGSSELNELQGESLSLQLSDKIAQMVDNFQVV